MTKALSSIVISCFSFIAVFSSCSSSSEICPASELDGMRWDFPSADKMEDKLKKGAACRSALVKGDPMTTDNFSRQIKFGGEAGKSYKVTIRVRGVVEPMMYKSGQQEGEYFYRGGEPNNKTYNIYKLAVSSPKAHYYFNRQDKVGHKIFTMDYTADIVIDAGATLTISGDGQNGKMIANFKQLTVPGVEDKPYNGQFVQLNVTNLEKVKK